jgi:hypothetical protein
VLEAVVAADPAAHGEDTAGVLDSTVLDDAVAAEDTVTQLIAAARRVGRHGLGAGARLHRPGKPAIARDDLAARDALVTDARRLLTRLEVGADDPRPRRR